MKIGYKFIGLLILIGSEGIAASPKTFCEKKFGTSVSLRFVPAEANGGIAVEDGMLGSKTTETKPKVSPTGFVCVIAPSTDEPDCRKKMNLDRTTFKNTYCISSVFPLKKLCPKEFLNYSDIVGTDLCKNK